MPGDDPRTDEELVAAANAGDRGALGALYLRHRDWCGAVALRFTKNRDEALDVVQQVFAGFFRQFPGFVLRCKLTTYLYPAVRNAAATRRRAARVRSEATRQIASTLAESADVPGPLEHAPLRRAVESLPEGQREVLLMRVVDQMSVLEIAIALDIPEGTVKSRMSHAIHALRADASLAEYFRE